MINGLDYGDVKFPVSRKDLYKIEKKNNIYINVFDYENGLIYPVHVSDEKFEDCMVLLLIRDDKKTHYVYIKDFNRFMQIKQTIRVKNLFADIARSALVVKRYW